ncbi:hypothetical protein [Legionella sainthelensi]|uniref:hypothetical protein n=1 Tax=Legionella sainthelensi TaxID=28087 RepID=UPI000E204575|nr:hypothetical protein [Legionella sainthelensi]
MLKINSLSQGFFNTKKYRLPSSWQKILFPLILLFVGNFYTYYSITHKHYPSFFYQNEFAPAVMFACGHGFANPTQISDSLQSFLDNKTTNFECKNIVQKGLKPLNYFQSLERYMILSSGFMWKIFGVSWNNLVPLFLLLYSISLLAIYSIFRLGLSQSFSLLLTLFIAISPLQMYYVVQLRDYSVAPFLLSIVGIIGTLVTNSPNRKKLLVSSFFSGSLLGLGLGFRTDILVMLPFFLISLLFFVKIEHKAIQRKLEAILIFSISFFAVGYPVLQAYHSYGGGGLAHVIILGLADSFTPNLGLRQLETYSIIPLYFDLVPYTIVNSFSERIYGIEHLMPATAKEYNYYSSLFLLNYLSTFPADFLVRIYASMLQVPLIFIHGVVQKIAAYIPLRTVAAVLPFFVTATIAFFQLRIALFILFTLLYLGAYPVLQFDPRHYFYLEFVGLWFIGFLIQYCIFFIKNKSNITLFEAIKIKVQARWKIISITSIVSVAILTLSIISLRVYQENHLNKLFNHYLEARTETINPILDEDHKNYIIKLPIKNNDIQSSYLETIYLRIKSKEKCPLNQISLKPHYLEKPPGSWSSPEAVTLSTSQTMTYFLPIYNFHNSTGHDVLDEALLPSYLIDSFEYSISDAICIQDIAYLTDINKIPLLLTLKLPQDWENTKLYQYFKKI